MANHKLSPEENARIVAAFFVPGVERCIDVLKELLAELQGEAVTTPAKSKAGGKRNVVAPDKHDEALRRVLAGEKVVDIAHDLGVNPASVYGWAKRVRDGEPPPQRPTSYWTDERRKEKGRQIKAAWRKKKKAEAAGT